MSNKLSFKKIFGVVKSYFLITVGLLCYTAAWDIFLIPNHLVGGGVTGIAAIVQYITGFPVSYTFFAINIILLLIALKVLGSGFGLKTVYAIVVASIFFKVLPELLPLSLIEDLAISNGKLLSTIIGGAMSGLGIGITFTQGGSTGGTDIIALMVSKYRNVSPGKIILTLDIFIIASSIIVPQDGNIGNIIATVIYGYILIVIVSYTLDLFLSGTKQSVQIFIFSKKYEEIADQITTQMHRGVTVLNGQGWYTKTDGKILLVIIRKSEANFVYKMIKEVDKNAFLSVASVMGVYGEGFDEMKVKRKRK